MSAGDLQSGPFSPKRPGSGRGGWIALGGAGVFLVIVLIVTNLPREASSPSEPNEYVQTWDQAYSDTTCDDWNGEMTAAQQFAAAADMLTGARHEDGDTGLPPRSLTVEFQAGITNVCVIPTMTLTDAAVGLYLTEPRFQP